MAVTGCFRQHYMELLRLAAELYGLMERAETAA